MLNFKASISQVVQHPQCPLRVGSSEVLVKSPLSAARSFIVSWYHNVCIIAYFFWHWLLVAELAYTVWGSLPFDLWFVCFALLKALEFAGSDARVLGIPVCVGQVYGHQWRHLYLVSWLQKCFINIELVKSCSSLLMWLVICWMLACRNDMNEPSVFNGPEAHCSFVPHGHTSIILWQPPFSLPTSSVFASAGGHYAKRCCTSPRDGWASWCA